MAIVIFDLWTNHQYRRADGFADGGVKFDDSHYLSQASNIYGDFHEDATSVGPWEKVTKTGSTSGTVTWSHDGNAAQVYGWTTLP